MDAIKLITARDIDKMNNISVTPKGGTIATEVSGNQVNLTAPSVVKLNLNQADIKSFTRNGSDLVVTTKSGEVVVIHKFYDANGDSDLVLQDDKGALWWVEDPGTEGFQFVSIDSTEGLLAENVTGDGTLTAFGIAGAALAGIGALIAGNNGGGGGGGGDNGGGDNGGGGDTTAPAAVSDLLITDNAGSVQGAITGGTSTDDNTPTLSGTAEAGTIVSIYDGTTLLGTVTVGADGRWSFTTPALGEGQHSLTVTVTDAAGNTSPATSPVDFTVDTQPPAVATDVALTNNSGGSTTPVPNGSSSDDNTPTLSGRGEAGAVVSVYDGQTLLGTALVGANGNWSFTTPALSNGSHSLTVTLTDAAGNVSAASSPFVVTIQAGLPSTSSSLQITDDSDATLRTLSDGASTKDSTPVLSGLASANAVITLYNGTTLLGSTIADGSGQWRFTPATLADGTYAFRAVATDAAGNVTTSVTLTVTIDTVAPGAAGDLLLTGDSNGTVTPIAAGGSSNDNTLVLSGTAEAGSTVTVRDGNVVLGTAIVGSNGSWSFTTPALSDGNHSLTTTVTDSAGNTGPASAAIVVTVDTTAPAAIGDLQVIDNVGASQGPLTSGATTDDNTPTLSGSGEAGALISIYDGSTLLGNTLVGANGSWSFTTPALSNGSHSLTVTQTDAAGNVSSATAEFVVNVDAALPPASASIELVGDSGNTLVSLQNGAVTNDDSPTLAGLTRAGSLVRIFDGGDLLGSTTADGNGQWSFALSNLSEGGHAFSATITDVDGNVIDTVTLNITVDTTPPTAASDLALLNDAGSTAQPVTGGSTINDATPLLSGTAEAGSIVTIRDGNTILGSVSVGSNGSWSFTTPALGEGNHSLSTTVTDAAGNVSPASTPIAFSVDTTAPAAVSGLQVTDNAGSATGALASGQTTDDRTPTLSGSAEAGAVVRIYDGTTLLGSVTAGSNGSWSFTPDALTNGQHSLTTTVTDAAGNVSPASPVFTVNIEAGVPATSSLLIVTDDNGSTLVELANNDSTTDSTPILSGQAGAGDLVTLYNGSTALGSVVAGSNGQWSFTPAALADGTYAFRASADNGSGTVTDSPVITITIDTVAPAAPTGIQLTNDDGDPLGTGSTNVAAPTLSGSGEAGGVVIISDGGTVIGSTTVGNDGNWSFTTPPLSDGSHSLTSTVTDAAGNTGPASTPVTVTVDTQAPAAAGNLQLSNGDGTPVAAGGSTNDTTPTLSGTAEPGSTVTVSDGDTVLGTATAGSDGSWSFTPTDPLSEGQHNLTSTVTDTAGNTGPGSTAVIVIVDTSAPAVASELLLSNDQSGTPVPVSNGLTNDTTPVLSGRAEPGSTVTISDGDTVLGTATVGNDGSWSFTAPVLAAGDHSLTATVTDTAGNTSEPSAALSFTIDTTTPAAPGNVQLSDDQSGTPVLITSGATNDTTPVLSGSGTAGSTITVSDGNTVLGTTTVNDDGSWSFTPATALGEGPHSLTATETSPAGNTSAPSAPLEVNIDLTDPAPAADLLLVNDQGATPLPIAADGVTNDTTPLFSGSAEPGSLVAIYDNGSVIGSAQADANGNWSFTPDPALEAGTHSLTTVVTDTAGNSGPVSDAFDFTIDLTTPSAAVDVVLNNDNGETLQPINSGTATNDTTPQLSGTADAGSTVTILDGNTVLGSVLVGAGGTWTYAVPTLSQGEHSLTTTVTSPAGNVSAPSAAIDFTVDTTAPAEPTGLLLVNDEVDPAVSVASGGATNDTTPVLSGSAEPDSVVIVRDNGVIIGSATVGNDGSWRFTPDTALEAGSHSLTASVTDPAGNVGPESAPYTFTVDLTPPAAPVDVVLSNNDGSTLVAIAANGATNDTTPQLSGSATAGSIITVYDGDSTTPIGSVTVGADGSWQFVTGTLDEGDHSLTVTVTDAAGNVSDPSAPISFTVDTTAPDAVVDLLLVNNNVDPATPIASGSNTNDSTPLLSGTAEPNSTIIVYDGQTPIGTATADNDGAWTFSPELTDGSHSLSVTVTDVAGNVSAPSASVAITVDTVAPSAVTQLSVASDNGNGDPVTIPNGGLTSDNTPVLSGSGDPGSLIVITSQDGPVGSVTVGSSGSWSFTPASALSDGSYTLTVVARDAAGNVSAPVTAQLVIDATAPDQVTEISLSNDNGSALVDIPSGSTTSDTTPLLAGVAEPGSTVNILDNGAPIGTAIAGSDGAWSFNVPTLTNAAHSLTVTVTDAAGNIGPASAPITFTVDSQAPAQATLEVNNDNGTDLVLVPDGTFTNDNTPRLSGTAEAGSLVTIYDGNVVLGSTTANADGEWVFLSPVLTDGQHTLTATVTDSLGNVSAPSSSFTVQVDATPPQPVSAVLLQNDNDPDNLVTIANGGATNDNTPLLSGSGEPGGLVNVYNGNVLVGSATVDSEGNWSLNTSPLDNGSYTLTVVVSDSAGNVSDPVSVGVTVNTVGPDPVLSFEVNANNGPTALPLVDGSFTNDTTPVLSGTAQAGAIINLLQDDTVIGSVVADANGVWRFETSALQDGSYAFSVQVVDAAGNVSEPVGPVNITVDTLVPDAVPDLVVADNVGGTTGPLDDGASTDDNTPTLSGTAEAGSTVSIYDGTTLLGTALAGSGGAWSFTTAALNNGPHSFTVTVTDAAGNVSTATPAFSLNVQADLPPATSTLQITDDTGTTLVTLADGAVTRDTTPTLSGSAEAGQLIRIYDANTDAVITSVTADANGQWSYTPTLAEGSYAYYITAQNPGGDEGTPSATLGFTVDITAPAVAADVVISNDRSGTAVPISDGSVINDNTPVLSGSAEVGSLVTVYDGNSAIASVVVGAGGSWTLTTPALSEGAHALSVGVSDAAGNSSALTAALNFTVDSIAPNASTLVITNDDTAQPVLNGGYSSDATPTLSGVAEAGSTVTILNNGDVLTTLTVPSGGNWSYTPAAALSEGSHTLSVSVTDAAGNVSTSTSATVIVDTLAPDDLTLTASNNNGSTPVTIADGGTTNDNTPLLRGVAEAGSVVTIRLDGDVVASLTVGSSGNWSYTSAALSDGSHTFSVTETDAAGNTGEALSVTLIVDATPPLVATNLTITNDVTGVSIPAGGATNDTTPTLSGSAEANATVSVYDGNTLLGTAQVNGSGAWSFVSPTLGNGAHALSVAVTDAAGNTGPRTTPVTITVDTVAPGAATLVVTNDVSGSVIPNGGVTSDTTPVLSGRAEAGSIVTVLDGTTLVGSALVGSDGNWTLTPATALSETLHTLNVTVTDAAGNVSATTSATLVIDTTPPVAITGLAAVNNNGSTPVAIAAGGVTNDSTPRLSGTAEANSIVTIRDGDTVLGSVTAASNGSWSFVTGTLSDGLHTFSVTATDAAGNTGPAASLALTVDTAPPLAATGLTLTNDVTGVAIVNNGVTNDSTPTLQGTAEANAIVTVYDGNTLLGTVQANASGSWSFVSPTLSNAAHALSVTVTDSAGNVSPRSEVINLTVDTVAPANTSLTIINDATGATIVNGGATNDTTPTLRGSVSAAEAGARVTILDNGLALGTAIVQADGSWSFTPLAALSAGPHPITVTVTDAAGNVSGTTAATVIIDTTAPAAITNLLALNNNGSTAVTIPNNGVTNDSTPLLSGNGEAGARITVYDGTTLLGSTTVGSNGSWSFVVGNALSNGSHTLNVTQTDPAGNVSPQVSTTLIVDTVVPVASTLTIIDDISGTPVTLANGAFTRDTTPTLRGTTEAGAVVTIYDGASAIGSVTAGSDGSWSFTTATLANGAHTLSTTVTDAAGNVSTGNITATVNVDTLPPAAVSGLAINSAGTLVTGSGEVGATVTVRDASGNALGTTTVGSGGNWSVTLTTAQITGAPLSVIQTDRAGNVSPGASLTGAIRIVATNDSNEVDYTSTQATVNNGTVNSSHTALLTVGLGTVLNASVLNNGNAYLFSVGNDDSRTVTLNGSVTSLGVAANYSLNLYEQQANGSWQLISIKTNYINALLTIGTLKGANVTYTGLGTGNYAVVVAATTNISVLPTTTVSTVSDFTTLAVTTAATVTGNLLTNDTSSIAGTIPSGTAVASVGSSTVASSGNTVINTTYGTLTIDAKGNYTYTLKAGLDIDTLPSADTFTYSVRDASGAVTSATLTVTLHNGAATALFATTSLAAETTTSSEHDASGSIWGDSNVSHSGTLSILNEHGDLTTVSSVGSTAVAGDFGVLTIAANGSYTYTLNADVNIQNITHKEVFTYTLASSDGTITSNTFTIELHPTITGSAAADSLTSSAYDDTITSGAGADTLVYHLLSSADATGGNGHDTWTDFSVAQGDKIDVSSLLIGWNDSTSNINDFVKVDHTADGNTVLSIDRDGSGTGYSSTQLITLEGVNVSLEELLQQPHQNHTA